MHTVRESLQTVEKERDEARKQVEGSVEAQSASSTEQPNSTAMVGIATSITYAHHRRHAPAI